MSIANPKDQSVDKPDNVDTNEIDKFSEIASRWWDTESEFKPLHDINPLRLHYINQHAPLEGKRVLDVGCGGGILSESMAQLNANVTGIDLSAPAIEVATLHAMEAGVENLQYKCCSTEEFAAEHAGSFDIVTCMEMLEHVPEPEDIVQACQTLLKPGGAAFFSTLNRNGKSWLMAIVGAEYLLNLIPRGTHDWDRFIKPSELASWCRQCDLQTENITGLHYQPLSKTYSTGPNTDVNYMMFLTNNA